MKKNNLKKLIAKKAQVNREKVAYVCGVSTQTVDNWVNQKTQPNFFNLIDMFDLFGLKDLNEFKSKK